MFAQLPWKTLPMIGLLLFASALSADDLNQPTLNQTTHHQTTHNQVHRDSKQDSSASNKVTVAAETTTKKITADSSNHKNTQTATTSSKTVAQLTTEALTAKILPSLVVITFHGRDGKQEGLGSGFVIDSNGIIATNHHVIGEARPIFVEFADGKRFDVQSVYASDRMLDLALLKIDAKDLKTLDLGDSSKLKTGQQVVAFGNPKGLQHSVVTGILSAKREIDGRPMLQLAIPVEPGNSGGPVVDMSGNVQGLMNMKSLVTDNLGFAIEVNALKPLIAKPNPILMNRWLTIGALDPSEWKTLFGARWWERAGRIKVEGMGTGFGGRALCLQQEKPPKIPFEVAVAVRMEPVSGAAGIVFHSDGNNRHYGFYPSGSRLRFSRFEGADVFSWKVLEEVSSPHFNTNDWNWLKVRVEENRILCFVNDQLVIESKDQVFNAGLVGLAKFRNTAAEFKQFQVAKEIPAFRPPVEIQKRIDKLVINLDPKQPANEKLIDELIPEGTQGLKALQERAKLLEEQSKRLKELAIEVHQEQVQSQLKALLDKKDSELDLIQATLLVAKMDNSELDVAGYHKEFSQLLKQLQKTIKNEDTDQEKINKLNQFLFEELGFHGSRDDYYNRANSYLNEVLDDREGIPITLCVLYMELANRIGLKLEGVGLPGHFVLRWIRSDQEDLLIDVYDKGKQLTKSDAATLVKQITGGSLREEHLQAVSKKAILLRMIHNLMNIKERSRDIPGMWSYLNAIIAIEPEAVSERLMRAIIGYQTHRNHRALKDVNWIIEQSPENVNLEQAHQLRRAIENRLEK